MSDYPSTIIMDGEEKVVSLYGMKGYFKWVVIQGFVLVDQNYLEELFLLHTQGNGILCVK